VAISELTVQHFGGMPRAPGEFMGARHYKELIAWQLAEQFKTEVFALVRASQRASDDRAYAQQLTGAASSVTHNIAEGFLRFGGGEFRRFLDYALGSLGEAEGRLADGIQLGYFDAVACETAFRFAKRCLVATVRLKRSQQDPRRYGN
jgi:four helix bundle protein